MEIKTGKDLAAACMDVAKNYKTLYVMGCFGAPLTSSNKKRYINAQSYNRKAARTAKINAAAADTFGFDCVCLIKSMLWGWNGDKTKSYGGAKYASNGVPDINADKMFKKCTEPSADFSSIQPGEAVWRSGHIGIYVGDGLAVESTPIWADGVQITAVKNIGTKDGYNARKWTKHGKLPYVSYESSVSLPVLVRGSRGEAVKALQTLLNACGCDCGKADGIFGSKTEAAIEEFEKAGGWDKLLGK